MIGHTGLDYYRRHLNQNVSIFDSIQLLVPRGCSPTNQQSEVIHQFLLATLLVKQP